MASEDDRRVADAWRALADERKVERLRAQLARLASAAAVIADRAVPVDPLDTDMAQLRAVLREIAEEARS